MNIDFHFNEKLPNIDNAIIACYWFDGHTAIHDIVYYDKVTATWTCDLWDNPDDFKYHGNRSMTEKDLDEGKMEFGWPDVWAILPDFRKETNEH